MAASSEPDWTSLPDLVSNLILNKFSEPKEVIRFGTVCKQWYFSTKTYFDMKKNHSHKPIPMLLYPSKGNSVDLYCMIENKIIGTIPFQFSQYGKFCGSSYGFLAFNNENNVITLVNPFKPRSVIQLPPLRIPRVHQYSFGVSKVVLSSDPTKNPEDWKVLVITDGIGKLAYTSPITKVWAFVYTEPCCISDAIFHKGLVYAIATYVEMLRIELGETPIVDVLGENVIEGGVKFLVESSGGDLLLIQKHDNRFEPNFNVYKLLVGQQSVGKVKMNSLEGEAVFVSHHHQSMSISGIKSARDSIWYLTKSLYRGYTLHAFDMKGQNRGLEFPAIFRQLVWIVPPFEFHSHMLEINS
ncbi:hypothetical protein ACFE04_017882 [Oxalis oulophora]